MKYIQIIKFTFGLNRNISFMLLFFCFIMFSNSVVSQDLDVYKEKLSRSLEIISENYFDSIDYRKISEEAVINMINQLDPYSVYVSSDNVENSNRLLEAKFDGIGIRTRIINDSLFIVGVNSGSPAEIAGFLPGDKVLNINGVSTKNQSINNFDIDKLIRSDSEEQNSIIINRTGSNEIINLSVSCSQIKQSSVDAAYMVDKHTAYFYISSFTAGTVDEFNKKITFFSASSELKNLIIDLRGNSGGLFSAAVSLADEFLIEGKAIVCTRNRKNEKETQTATTRGYWENGRLIILIDEKSASASEIVAGAVQDWDRGVILGNKSFGKGLVQRPYYLPDGSMIRLSIASYCTPSGRSIQKNLNQISDFATIDSSGFKTLVNKRKLLGYGGITPDLMIDSENDLFIENKSLIDYDWLLLYSMYYFQKNLNWLRTSFIKFDQYNEHFIVDDKFIVDFIDYCNSFGHELSLSEIEPLKKELSVEIKALIASFIFDLEKYYIVSNTIDNYFLEAHKLILSKKRYKQILNPKR